MKNTICTLSILLGVLFSAQKKVDVRVSYGTESFYGISESMLGNAFNAFNILDPNRKIVTYTSDGVFALDLMLHSSDSKWKYGLGYNHESVKDSNLNFSGDFNTVLAQASYNWTNPENKLKLYSGAGVGAVFASLEQGANNSNDVIFAFNVSPIGISYGEKFGVFLETNFGTKGMVQGGVSYTF